MEAIVKAAQILSETLREICFSEKVGGALDGLSSLTNLAESVRSIADSLEGLSSEVERIADNMPEKEI